MKPRQEHRHRRGIVRELQDMAAVERERLLRGAVEDQAGALISELATAGLRIHELEQHLADAGLDLIQVIGERDWFHAAWLDAGTREALLRDALDTATAGQYVPISGWPDLIAHRGNDLEEEASA